MIGLTLVAIELLPELATTIAATRRETDRLQATSSANLFNILVVMGITAAVKPISLGCQLGGSGRRERLHPASRALPDAWTTA